ncbi:zinc dependent phospholipase C family protein [Sediminibacillus massiliensis]|uniref:zinc dependent phospholipase C family protein n=1 Tax=Sediminibacillus massiliensis TaxID=1926277 RepID=UPI000988892E|nr:zinc dependent phospholipase C family protein [Sediminibacillus massiliensis]
MPNIWTHMLFCEELIDNIGQSSPIARQEKHLNLGAQGPDPFFYHNFWPWKKEQKVNEVGSLLHTEKCGDFMMDLIISANNYTNQTKAYVFGFVTHHILDRNTHPYIHYKAGFEGNKHQLFEVIIDTLLMERFRSFKTWKAPVYKEIDVGKKLDSEICELMHESISRHYIIQEESTQYIQESYRDMKRALRVLYDPYGWKNAVLSSFISSFSHQPIRQNKDYLNDNKDPWFHPATKEPSKESFIQLFDKAKHEGEEIMKVVIDYWQSPSPSKESKLRTLVRNVSYDTGKELTLGLTNRYCEPIV